MVSPLAPYMISSGFEVVVVVFNRSIRTERAILEDDRQVVEPERPRQTEPSIGAIIDDDHSRQAHINLASGVVMRMRMEPKRRGRLVDGQNRTPTIAWMNKLLRPAVVIAGHQEPMPMNRCDKVERIFDRHLHFIAAAQADDWPKDRCRVAIGPVGFP